MKTLLYEESVGPFSVTVFAAFQLIPATVASHPGTVVVDWLEGPNFSGAAEDLITGDLLDVIKVLPGRVAEFQVYQNPRGLEITVRTLFPHGQNSKSSVETYGEQKAVIDAKLQALQQESQGEPRESGNSAIPPRKYSSVCGVRDCPAPYNVLDCTDPRNPRCIAAFVGNGDCCG